MENSLLPLGRSQNGTATLRAVGMLDLLENDPRPTFVIDTSPGNEAPPIYWNAAMASHHSGKLLNAVISEASVEGIKRGTPQFQTWFLSHEAMDQPFVYRNFRWFKILVANHWNVISGISNDTSIANESPKLETLVHSRKGSKTKVPTLDWTDEVPPSKISSHVAWARSIDWSSTSLGPMSSWSSQLRSIANLVMQDPRPAVVFYGPDLIMIYNEAEIELLGGFHPCMGVSARVALKSVWSQYFEPIITENLAGNTVEKINTAIHMVRNGFMEETYFSLKFIPILDSNGLTVGHYEPLVETVSLLPTTLTSFPYVSRVLVLNSWFHNRRIISGLCCDFL